MIEIGTAIEDRIRRDQIAVPPYPAVALRLGQLLVSETASTADLLGVLKSDQVLAATLLRVANSGAYSRGEAVSSLSVAMNRIGLMEIQRLALAGSLSPTALAPGPLAALRRQDWTRALASAFFCERLAVVRRLDPESAFVCGLLHEFGRVVVISTLEHLLLELPHEPPRTAVDWAKLVDLYHVEVGMVVAARWKLPPSVEECVLRHHGADLADCTHPEMLQLVWAADAVVEQLDAKPELDAHVLGSMSLLVNPDERRAIADVIPHLPRFIASFDGPLATPTAPHQGPGARDWVIAAAADPSLGIELDVEMNTFDSANPLEDATEEAFLLEDEVVEPHAVSPAPPPTTWRSTVVLKGPRPARYEAVAVSPTGLRMRGKEALPSNRLMEYELDIDPLFGFWATVVRCQQLPDETQDIELKLFALHGPTARRWDTLTRGAPQISGRSG